VPRLIRTALENAKVKGGASGVDVIGDIAIVRLAGLSAAEKRRVGRSLLAQMKNVRVALEQEGGIQGEYRLRKLRHLAGEERTTTVHRENGCSFNVDVARCYFSPRLSTERLRVAGKVRKRERVLNMFAGVGPYSIEIARFTGAKVTSCEVNRLAAKLHEENNRLNKVADLVTVIHGDAQELPDLIDGKFDRVLMPFPAGADKFLDVAMRMSRKGGIVHYYRHLLGRNELEAANALREELAGLLPDGTKYEVRRVREVGPRWIEMVAEIRRRS
jgi:tRNA (guanine37-N1)-methyltransferase